ncbi:MAG TPA: hypothetical protein VGD99_15215 [Anaerolineae bacterium]
MRGRGIKKWRGLSVSWTQREAVPLDESSRGRLAGAATVGSAASGEYKRATPPLVARRANVGAWHDLVMGEGSSYRVQAVAAWM